MSSIWGEKLKISVFGGSHTTAIGVVLDGLPAGETVDMDALLRQMARRAPGQDSTATQRKEADTPEILSGLLENELTGAPLCAVIRNTDQHSKDYSELKTKPRPGHADYTAFLRYGGANDVRGGGHFSGRLTAPLVFAGAICRQLLEKRGVHIGAHVYSVGDVCDTPFDPVNVGTEELRALSLRYFPTLDAQAQADMRAVIEEKRLAGDSVGGVVECAVTGFPAGVGDPMFGGLENRLAQLLFGIPAVKGVEFGDGFAAAQHCGSENNDAFYFAPDGTVRTRTNHSGGILGGISTGMPLVFRAAFKPTPSISREQDTVDLSQGVNTRLAITGRHDPCIVPRAVPVVESVTAIVLTDLLL